MNEFPLFTSSRDAIEFHNSSANCPDAIKASIVARLSADGYSNKSIRKALNINKVYTVTHLKRVGTALSESELQLWHNNSKRITLGHVRAISKLPKRRREELLRELLIKRTSVHSFEKIAKGEEITKEQDPDIKRYEEVMAEMIGRPVKIHLNKATKSGTIKLGFFGYDDLDNISKSLGFDSSEHI